MNVLRFREVKYFSRSHSYPVTNFKLWYLTQECMLSPPCDAPKLCSLINTPLIFFSTSLENYFLFWSQVLWLFLCGKVYFYTVFLFFLFVISSSYASISFILYPLHLMSNRREILKYFCFRFIFWVTREILKYHISYIVESRNYRKNWYSLTSKRFISKTKAMYTAQGWSKRALNLPPTMGV